VTPKGYGRDPIIFEAPNLRNGASYTHGDDGPFIERACDESNGLVIDNVYCLVKIIEKNERIIAAVQL